MKRLLITLALLTAIATVAGASAIIFGADDAKAADTEMVGMSAAEHAKMMKKARTGIRRPSPLEVLYHRVFQRTMIARAEGISFMAVAPIPEDLGNHKRLGDKCYTPGKSGCCWNGFRYVACVCRWSPAADGYYYGYA